MADLLDFGSVDPTAQIGVVPPIKAKKREARILVVDDDPSIAKLLAAKLRQCGFGCWDCLRGEKALEQLRREEFDAVISDLRMPGISGLELLKQVRTVYRHLAFLMATGVDDVRVGIQIMKEGADDYLMKPFQFEAVAASVHRAIEKRQLEQAIENYRRDLEQLLNQRTRELQGATESNEQTCEDTLEALAATLGLRDNETAEHSRRVMRYCLEIAKVMGCSSDHMRQNARGAYLHDIGKIGIPDAILRKPGMLTAVEWAIMKTHARIGYELAERIPFLSGAAVIILTHHERFDGKGYPQGLMGNEISLGARIFAVADTLDAMTSDRPYRKALRFSDAREEIIRQSGRQFDPEVVKAFLAIPEKAWEDIRLEVDFGICKCASIGLETASSNDMPINASEACPFH